MDRNIKITTHNEKETFDFALKLAKKAKGGEVYALSGDLGAGKTVFVRGFAAGLGVKRNVNSPTFVLMKIYPVKKHKTINEICHIDAYRLKTARDLEAIGALDYFGREGVISFLEWPEALKKLLPAKTIRVEIKHKKEEIREIQLKNQP
jgi:tRNA threonylcarbamoyladenosine biosynthesis protein TsaE